MGKELHVMNKEQIKGLRVATKIASATLKHALENTQVRALTLVLCR
jgi:hypothetical protein